LIPRNLVGYPLQDALRILKSMGIVPAICQTGCIPDDGDRGRRTARVIAMRGDTLLVAHFHDTVNSGF
jgi:hypothetical protein